MIAPIGRGRFYDLAHKGCISLCMGVTFLGTLGYAFGFVFKSAEFFKNKKQSESLSEEIQDAVLSKQNIAKETL